MGGFSLPYIDMAIWEQLALVEFTNRRIKGLAFTTAKHELIFDRTKTAANEEVPLDVTCMSAKILETGINAPFLNFLNITINTLPDSAFQNGITTDLRQDCNWPMLSFRH